MIKKKVTPRNTLIAFLSLIVIVVIASAVGGLTPYKIQKLWKTITFFNEDKIVENFRNMSAFNPYREIHKGDTTFEFTRANQDLPETFEYDGKTINVKELLAETGTTGFLVIKNNRIVFEEYFQGNTEDALHISWSVGKSFVSALMGIAVDEGYIQSINDPVTQYAPELEASGYNGVPIKDVLQMSSGVGFDEDYGAFNSDINRMGRTMALGGSINEFAASLKRERKPGEYHHYVSMDTQVLGMVIKNAIGQDLSTYLEEKIWQKIGMESNARWLIDKTGMELAFGTLNVTLRDFARFGQLYLNNGNWNGKQVVPEKWVKASVTPDAPQLQPGDNPLSSERFGYGYQWWVPEKPKGDFMALGVYGQHIYVNPQQGIVIVKNSAYADWVNNMESDYTLIAMYQHFSDVIQ